MTSPIAATSNATSPNVSSSNATGVNTTSSNATAEGTKAPENEKLRSISVKAEKSFSIRKRRSMEEEDEADGVKKMAARGDHYPETKMPPMSKRAANEGKYLSSSLKIGLSRSVSVKLDLARSNSVFPFR